MPGSRGEPFEASRIFGERVRSFRESKGWSQERLAGEAGLSWSYVSHLERASHSAFNPTLRVILLLAEALGVDPSELMKSLPAPR